MRIKHILLICMVIGFSWKPALSATITFLAHFDDPSSFNADFGHYTAPTIVGTPVSVAGLPALGAGNLAVELNRLNEYITYPAIGNVRPTDGLSLGFWVKQSHNSMTDDAISYKFGGIERVDYAPGADSLVATYGEASAYRSAARGYDAGSAHYNANPVPWHHMIPDQWLYYNIDVKTTSDGNAGHYRIRVYNDSGSLLAGVGGNVEATTVIEPGQLVSFNILDTTKILLGGGPVYAGGGIGPNSSIVLDEFAIWNGSLLESEVDAIVAGMVNGTALVKPHIEEPVPFVRPTHYGNEWVRNNPFMIFARGANDANDPLVGQLHLNAVEIKQAFLADIAVNRGLNWIAHPSDEIYATGVPLLTDQLKAQITNYVIYGGMNGVFQLADEPAIETMDAHAEIASWIRQTYPSLMTFATAGWSLTPEYLDALMTKVQPDILMYDIYPILHNNAFDLDYHFEHLTLIRDKARQYNVPAYAWLQSLDDSVRRTPSESELRMLAYSYLTAGYKGLGHFRYTTNAAQNGLLDANGVPRDLFYAAAGLNQEIAQLGNVLRLLESTDLRFIPGTRHPFGLTFLPAVSNADQVPVGLTAWNVGAGDDPYLQSVAVQAGNPGQYKNGLIGFFTDDDAQHYFMLTNLYQGMGLSAADSALTFVLQFSDDIESLWRFNSITGQIEQVFLTNHTLIWTLPGGTGDLFGYSSSFVPEPGGFLLIVCGMAAFARSRRHHCN